MTIKPEEKEHQQDKEDQEDTECRKTLLQSYDSKTTTHAALIVALTIGALTLISRWDAFFNKELVLKWIFYVTISFIVGLSVYVVGRLMFWGSLSHTILYVGKPSKTPPEGVSKDVYFDFDRFIKIVARHIVLEESKDKKSIDEESLDLEIQKSQKRPAIWQFHEVAMQVLKSRAVTTDDPSPDEKQELETSSFSKWLYYKFLNASRDLSLWFAAVSIGAPLSLFFLWDICQFYGCLIWLICVGALIVLFLSFSYGLLFLTNKQNQMPPKPTKRLYHQRQPQKPDDT